MCGSPGRTRRPTRRASDTAPNRAEAYESAVGCRAPHRHVVHESRTRHRHEHPRFARPKSCAAPRPGMTPGVNVARVADVLGAATTTVFRPAGLPGRRSRSCWSPKACSTTGSDWRNHPGEFHHQRFEHRSAVPFRAARAGAHAGRTNRVPAATASSRGTRGDRGGQRQPAPRGATGLLPAGGQRVRRTGRDVRAGHLRGGLRNVTSGVYLLKPSVRELRECVGRELLTEEENSSAPHANSSSAAPPNACWCPWCRWRTTGHPQQCAPVRPAHVHSVSGVGAGDAMVAGVAVGLTRGWRLTEAVRLGWPPGPRCC